MNPELPPDLSAIEERLRRRPVPSLPPELRTRVLRDRRPPVDAWTWALAAAGLLLALNAVIALANRPVSATGPRITAPMVEEAAARLQACLPDADPALLRRGIILAAQPTWRMLP